MSVTPDPFTDTPVIHFGAHLWPTQYENQTPHVWAWHIEKWNEMAELVNGQCIVGVVTGPDLVPVDVVRGMLSPKFTVVDVGPNTTEGENHTFRMLQERVPCGQNDVLIYAHGKGGTLEKYNSLAVRLWTEMLYESVTFNHASIVQRLAEGYPLFGAFRVNKPLHKLIRYGWYFSGTFFAVRCKYLRERPVVERWGGVEFWPGTHFRSAGCWTEFVDDIRPLSEYEIDGIYPKIVVENFEWEIARLGGERCEQHKREIEWFLPQLRPTDRVLVIGSNGGGVETKMKAAHEGLTTLSIDIKARPGNPHQVLIGNSTEPRIQTIARRAGPYDVVFIDGDHSYAGVKSDWDFALKLKPRLIAFHDVADAIMHWHANCLVSTLWSDIKRRYRTTEKIVGCGWGGIGVVHLEEGQ